MVFLQLLLVYLEGSCWFSLAASSAPVPTSTNNVNLKYFSLISFSHNVGAIIQSTLDEDSAKTHSAALSELTAKASHIVGLLNRDDELTFLRIRSKQREIMVGEKFKCKL